MAKLVVSEFVSMDGVMEAPGGPPGFKHAGWTGGISSGDEGTKFKYDELMEADAQLLGRVTYEGFAAAWPGMIEMTGDFGQKMNDMPKYVVSSTLDTAEWNNTNVLRGDVVEEVRKLKQQVAGVIVVFGSGQLVNALVQHDLVDELRLMVHPVVVGSGKRLFGESAEVKRLRLVGSRVMEEVVVLTFAPAT